MDGIKVGVQSMWNCLNSTNGVYEEERVSSLMDVMITFHQSYLFQLSQFIIFSSFLCFNTKSGSILFHSLISIGLIISSFWSFSVICSISSFGWTFLIIIINFIQLLYLIHSLKTTLLYPELSALYHELFEPMNISKESFNELLSPEIASIVTLSQGETYALANVTKTDRLSLLLSGKMNVISGNNYLHSIKPFEFLDSPEFDSYQPGIDSKFKVSIVSITHSTFISWSRPLFDEFLFKHFFFASLLSLMISKDIADKLFAMNSKIVTKQGSHLDIRLPAITTSLCNSLTSLVSNETGSPSGILSCRSSAISSHRSSAISSRRSSARSSISSLRIKDRSIFTPIQLYGQSSLHPAIKSNRSKSLQVNSLAVPVLMGTRGKRQSTGSIFSYQSNNGISSRRESSARRGSLSPNRIMM